MSTYFGDMVIDFEIYQPDRAMFTLTLLKPSYDGPLYQAHAFIPDKIHIGDIGQLTRSEKKWETEAKYQDHNYDLVRVMGLAYGTPVSSKILVYGNKFGQHEVDVHGDYAYHLYDVKRGDLLLLEMDETRNPAKANIIRNITQLLLQQAHDEYMEKTW